MENLSCLLILTNDDYTRFFSIKNPLLFVAGCTASSIKELLFSCSQENHRRAF